MIYRRHSDCVNAVRLAISRWGGFSVPYTVGRFRALDSDRVIKVGEDGIADILACIGGRFVAIEVKKGKDRQREDQKKFQKAVEEAGGLYVLARFTDKEDGVETVSRRLSGITKENPI